MDPRTLLIVTLLAAAASGQSFRDMFRDIFGSLSRPGNSTSGGGTRTSFWYPEFTNLFGQRQFSVRLAGNNTREDGMGTIVSNCQVGAGGRGLRDCFYRGVGTTEGSCNSDNVAGVICGRDPSSPYGGRMDVRLRGGGTRGDVEVRYGGRGWGPVCGDGFDVKDAMVVCRQLSLGAAKKSYISGRRASGEFILAGVECSGRETSLAQCRSERGDSVRCAGNQFSGAAVECAGQQSRGITQKYQCYIERGTRPPQGIRAGCADIYGSYIDCQWIDVTDIRSGKYVLRVRINADRKVPEVSFDDNQVICSVDLNLEDETVRVTNCRNAPL
ncbi:Lysyl oxidase 3A [Amphibalanus amphitrite]|uniref:Lysyl oxidase 3A n=1 Tax=Amphibalanus amphitrite TaxID=1232801 RepID=A0A6A4WPW4_AMPAM|nr:Lysyl oxidase 3A [Amphibalanus amphitrite]